MANYSAGLVLIEQEKLEPALEYMKCASDEAALTHNLRLQGLIYVNLGYIHSIQFLNKESISYYKQAYNAFKQGGKTEDQLNCLNAIASNYLVVNELDSAIHYYTEAEKIAVESGNQYFLSSILNNKSSVFIQRGQYRQALNELHKAAVLSSDSALRNKLNLNLAKSYYQLHQPDSLGVYVDKLVARVASTPDLPYKSSVYSFLSEVEKERKNYTLALSYLELYNTTLMEILKDNQSKALIEAEKRYDYTYHKNQTERIKLQNKYLLLVDITVILAFVLILVLVTQRQKRKRILAENEQKLMQYQRQQQELENKLLRTQVDHFGYNNKTLRQIVEQVNGLYTAIQDKAQAGLFHEKSERYQEIQQVMKETKKIIQKNTGSNSKRFLIRQQLLPEEVVHKLSDDDAVIISMIYSGEDRKNIATTLSTSMQAIYNRIPRLQERLKNLGIPESKIALLLKNLDK